ncbi:hypothetical protein SH1V18_07400 [Vallitalea longa]|uniref:Uncharacterized protein n=1 Tax=Vallitalea longa TaxID=2936439 RepID=A0A9W6DDJ3_9FIRM|nr:hypothetical protein [Vallitalea longa]GKX28260.1 hypothetical protein SH1V18_07400 [Vallitalea longa]
MKHTIKIAILLAVVTICLTGCKGENTNLSTESNKSMEDSNGIESIGTDINSEADQKEIIKICDQKLKIAIKKYDIDDFTPITELPDKLIFSGMDLPDNFEIEDVVIKKYAGIDWNYSSYICSFQLIIGESQGVFSFGNGALENAKEDESIFLDSKYNLQTGYLDWDNHIVLLSYNKQFGEISYDCYDYYGEPICNYQFKNYSNADNFKIVSADMSSFYLMYDKDDKKMVDTYSFGEKGISLTKRQQLKDDVVNIYEDENTIFVEYIDNNNHFIAICDKSFAVMDVIQIDNNINVESFDYKMDREKCNLLFIAKIDGKLFQSTMPINNNYSKIHPYTVLVDEDSTYNKKYEHHYIINDGYWIFDNGINVEEDELLDGNYKGINYFKLVNGDIVKSNSEYTACHILEKPYNDVVRFMNIDDYYVGLNSNDEICYIDKDYEHKCINEKFIGEKMSFRNVFFNKSDGSTTYINKEEKTINTITKDGEKKVLAKIPDDIWETAYEEQYNNNLKMGYDEEGIGIIGYHILYYYSFSDKNWHTIKTEEEINFIVNYGYIYNYQGITNKLNTDTYAFEPYFINRKDIYNTMVIDDILYVNMFNEYDMCEDDTNHISFNSEYVPFETTHGKYMLTELKLSKQHKVFKEYKSNRLYHMTEKECNQVIDDPVRLYSLSDEGILYTGYEEKAYLYYYDLNTKTIEKLYSDSYVNDLALIDGYAYFKTVDSSQLKRIELQNKTLETLDVKESSLYFDSSRNYIAIASKDDTTIYIIDLDEFQIIDNIVGADFKWDNDILYYDCKGYLCKYDPLNKQTIIMANITYPSVEGIHNNNLYYLACYDGPAALGVIPIDESYEFEDESKSIDYYLIYNETHYYSHLLLYNNHTKRLNSLVDAEKITYEVKDNIIRFKGESYDTESQWKEVKVERGANIIQDSPKYY